MNKNERERYTELYGSSLEEGHYFAAIDAFCEVLTEAYNCYNEDCTKWELLMETLESKLPMEVYVSVFGAKEEF